MSGRECKRCLLLQSGDEKNYRLILEHIAKIPERDKTGGAEYASRLDICRECDFLLSGACLKCGCYPEFRAAFKKNKCPVKRW